MYDKDMDFYDNFLKTILKMMISNSRTCTKTFYRILFGRMKLISLNLCLS